MEDPVFEKHPISVLLPSDLPQPSSLNSAPPSPAYNNHSTLNNNHNKDTLEDDFSSRKFHTLKPSIQIDHADENSSSQLSSDKDTVKPSRNPFDPSRLPSNMRLTRQRSRSQLVIPVLLPRLNLETPVAAGDENLPRTPHGNSAEDESKLEDKKDVSESNKVALKELTIAPSNSQHYSLFGKLPVDLLRQIVVYLETSVDICAFMLVCKFIKDIVDDEETWSVLCCDQHAFLLKRSKQTPDKIRHLLKPSMKWKDLFVQFHYLEMSLVEIEKHLSLLPATHEYEYEHTIIIMKVLNYLKKTNQTNEYIQMLYKLHTLHLSLGNHIEAAQAVLDYAEILPWDSSVSLFTR